MELLWVSGISHWNGRQMMGGSAETHLIVVCFFYSHLKNNMMDRNLVFPVPPDDIIKKPAYPTFEVLWGSGLSWRNGRWRTMGGGRGRGGRCPWFPCCENIKWLMCTFFNRQCCCFWSKHSDALLYLKLWYSFYIRVEYQRLHENNLARRAQLMWVAIWRKWRTRWPAKTLVQWDIGVTIFRSHRFPLRQHFDQDVV